MNRLLLVDGSNLFSLGQKIKIIISLLDSDFFQLITNTVSVLHYHRKNTIICTPHYIKEKFNIMPSQYADFKFLTADTADNIKGAEKVGLKTAALPLAHNVTIISVALYLIVLLFYLYVLLFS